MRLIETNKSHLLYIETGKLPLNFRFMALMIIIAGASLIFTDRWQGIFMIVPMLVLLMYKEGFVFDLKNHSMSDYYHLFGFEKIYKTKHLVGYKYLSIVRVGVIQNSYLKNFAYSDASLKYKLTLIKNQKEYFKVFTDEYFKVFAMGKKIANHFNLGLVDYSKGQANWVIPVPDDKKNNE